MLKTIFPVLCLAAFIGLTAVIGSGQAKRTSVAAAEVTGTFRYSFPAKFKGSSSDIKILALGGGKIRVAFDLVYPHFDSQGELTANLGTADGIAAISGDTAVYESSESGPCRITIRFIKPGTIRVDQDVTDADCGFGYNVTASGTYRKVSSKKPKFVKQ
jgi:hypothetical protein